MDEAEKRGAPGLFIGALIALAILPLVEGTCAPVSGLEVASGSSVLPSGAGLLTGLTLVALLGLLGASILGWFRGRWARAATSLSAGIGVGSILLMPAAFSRLKGVGASPQLGFYVSLVLGGLGFIVNVFRTFKRPRPPQGPTPGGPGTAEPPSDRLGW